MISPSFDIFFMSNLIYILLIASIFALTSFLNWFIINVIIGPGSRVLRVASFKMWSDLRYLSGFAWFLFSFV